MTGYDEYQLRTDIRAEFDRTNKLIKTVGIGLITFTFACFLAIYILLRGA